MKYTIGADFGTLSARAVLVDTGAGKVLAEEVANYPHGVIDRNNPCGMNIGDKTVLANPADYLDALVFIIHGVVKKSGVRPDDIVGIAVDATSCSLLPLDSEMMPLSLSQEFQNNQHAYIKLWKHFAAKEYGDRMNSLAEARGESFLRRYGLRISGEWMFPKIMEILFEAPEVDTEAVYYADLCDWLTWQLTGEISRSRGVAGYKTLWSPESGYPSADFLELLHPKLPDITRNKLSGKVLSYGMRAGNLTEEMARKLGLKAGIAVAAGLVDGHAPIPAVGLGNNYDLLMGIGTSATMMYLNTTYRDVAGIAGVIEDGLFPGYYGYVAGQNAVGDMFEWFQRNSLPEEYAKEARARSTSTLTLLSEKAARLRPGESGLVALDWWNGNRSVLKNSELTGLILGFTLGTGPEAIYRALVEAAAFGAKRILEQFRNDGLTVARIIACGGIAYKDAFLMQTYADILQQELRVSGVLHSAALGSAIYAAVAAGEKAGGYESVGEAVDKMAQKDYLIYTPNANHKEVYARLYQKYLYLHDLFGVQNKAFMKELSEIETSFMVE